MKRSHGHHILTGITILSVLLFIIAAMLWVVAHWYSAGLEWHGSWVGVPKSSISPGSTVSFKYVLRADIDDGCVLSLWQGAMPGRWGGGLRRPRSSSFYVGQNLDLPHEPRPEDVIHFGGFTFAHSVYHDPQIPLLKNEWRIDLAAPFWFVLSSTALLPAWRCFRLWRQLRRTRRGRCPNCGYDLRFAGGRCPECGRIALGRD
jgi:hypothetical protein